MAEAAAFYPPDAAPAAPAIEAGRLLFAGPCDFVAGADNIRALPAADKLPEVAFLGRSNVGKSSLLNALTGRKALARVSRTPGRTRQINFFDLGHRLMLVDLPGYGYARAARHDMNRWADTIGFYLKRSTQLQRALILIDARHGLKDNDRDAFDFVVEKQVVCMAVLTKADELKPQALAAMMAATHEELTLRATAYPAVFAVSAREGFGIPELRAALATLAAPRR
jgi:GTP-binding protein